MQERKDFFGSIFGSVFVVDRRGCLVDYGTATGIVSQHCAEYLDVVILPRSGGTRTYTTKWYDALVSYAWLLHGTLDFENFRIVPYGDSSGKKNDVFSSSSVYMVERDADSNDNPC